MANVPRIDVLLPFTEDGSGGLQTVTGNELASQRIVYGYTISPGDIIHRPDWGAGLEDFSNRKPTDDNLNRLKNQADRFLTTLPFLEAHAVNVVAVDGDSATIETEARTDEGELLVPDVTV